MKIIIATPLYPPEIERLSIYSKTLAKYLKNDHQVTVLAYAQQIEEEDNIKVVKVDKNQPLFARLFSYTWRLFKLAKQADIIYAQNAVASGLPAIIVKYLTKTPVLVNYAEDEAWKRASNLNLTQKSFEDFLLKPDLRAKIARIIKIQSFVLRQATKVVVSSSALAKLLTKAYKVSINNIIVSHSPEDRSQKLEFEMNIVPRQIFTSGPLLDWSGTEELVQTIAKLKEKFSDIKLIISGDGRDKDKLRNLIKELALVNNVEILGQISKAQEWYLFKTSQIYVNNFSGIDLINNLSKAILSHTAILAKNTEFNKEILKDKMFLFDDDIYQKIEAVIEDSNLRQELSSKLKLNLEKQFSWPAHITSLNNAIDIICTK